MMITTTILAIVESFLATLAYAILFNDTDEGGGECLADTVEETLASDLYHAKYLWYRLNG